jgi:hypothetical protein
MTYFKIQSLDRSGIMDGHSSSELRHCEALIYISVNSFVVSDFIMKTVVREFQFFKWVQLQMHRTKLESTLSTETGPFCLPKHI